MSFSIAYLNELFEKTYKEGVRASELGRYQVAKSKFIEAAKYSKRLAQLDKEKQDIHESRAERLLSVANKLPDTNKVDTAKKTESRADSSSGYSSTDTATTSTNEDMSSFYTFFDAEALEDGFDSVIGLSEAKEAITEYVINPIKYPDSYNYKFISSKCILLEGPPGTGKTTFAKAVAKEISQPFALVNVASLVNCYVGETGKIIDKVFNSLREYVDAHDCGITVFFDEFDEIAKSRTGDDKASQTAVPALLRNLDGVKENKNFLILANTNCKDMLDPGILSRFRKKIYIPLPDQNMREIFFKEKLKQLEEEYLSKIDFGYIASVSEGLSGRTITQICDDFLHFIGGVKAGLRTCEDYNQALAEIIQRS